MAAGFVIGGMLPVLAAACGGASEQPALQSAVASTPTPATSTSVPRATLVPVPSLSSESSPAGQQAAVDAAVQEAAVRLGLASGSGVGPGPAQNQASGAGDIHVQQVEPRQWPDASLGCPRQGEQYLQVVTPGFLVVVSAGGKQLEYHADSRGRVVFCQER